MIIRDNRMESEGKNAITKWLWPDMEMGRQDIGATEPTNQYTLMHWTDW